MRKFSKGETVLLEYFNKGWRGERDVKAEAEAVVIHSDDEVTVTRREYMVGGHKAVQHWVFLAPEWHDDRAQLWRIRTDVIVKKPFVQI